MFELAVPSRQGLFLRRVMTYFLETFATHVTGHAFDDNLAMS